ncbi:Arv1-like family-domain containing protein [Nitzschia inconspicua]|uniref:Protein ARV n=1 Tax=Nitzschia inconspicua TaxID=303405 RepID=A0A9K3Q4G0_9STRA|nr:Arv1-like family-domain containing protein [Nitzschia inconspicua]KAG7370030.1 Arv1-like family-domain containing protein [Nitzschia inconspicua]
MSAKDGEKDPSFVCVHCGAPCTALYRKLSASSIKATTCVNERCQQVVDPYIEREWLLVAIDWILLRLEAYRHVLFNAKKEFPLFESVSWGRALQLTIASCFLHAYLQYEAAKRNSGTDATMQGGGQHTSMILLIVASILDLMIRWWGVSLFVAAFSKSCQAQKVKIITTRLFWSFLLPTAFHVTSIFVLIWENSKTTRALGSLLVAGWQCLAVSLVADDVAPGYGKVTAAVGLALGILWRLVFSQITAVPCLGFEVDLFFQLSEQNKLWPPICLT